jgi:hypothetical protein
MNLSEGVHYDPETVILLRTALDAAWSSLVPTEQARRSKTEMAQRILRRAATGERDPDRLKAAALLMVV